MSGPYFGFVAASYGAVALAIAGLILFTALDARAVRARLRAMEARAEATRRAPRAPQ